MAAGDRGERDLVSGVCVRSVSVKGSVSVRG
jgi:hypothetical protein